MRANSAAYHSAADDHAGFKKIEWPSAFGAIPAEIYEVWGFEDRDRRRGS